jgi:hypothetical protein
MSDLIKIIIQVILAPTNYSELSTKLFLFLFLEVWIATFFLRDIPEFGVTLHDFETDSPLGTALSAVPNFNALNPIGLIIALLIALLCYVCQLHDRISDIFGIRRRFDRNNILLPLALLVGAKLSSKQLNGIILHRESLMREVFYRFASSRADSPLVDKHDIEHALGAWSWYWVLLEGMAVFLGCAAISLYYYALELCCGFGIMFIFYWFWATLLYPRLEGNVRPQIEAIAGDYTAALKARQAFELQP